MNARLRCVGGVVVLMSAVLFLHSCSQDATDAKAARNVAAKESCKDLTPAVPPGQAFDPSPLHGKLLADAVNEFMAAYYIEFAHLRWLDTSHAAYFSRLQEIQDAHPLFSMTIVLHEGDRETNERAAALVRQAARLRTVKIVVDDGSLAKQFQVANDCFAAFVLDSASRLKFWRCCAIEPDEVEQLAARFGGSANYPTAHPEYPSVVAGQVLPAVEVRSVGTGDHIPLSQATRDHNLVIAYVADCSICRLKEFLRQVRSLTEHADRIRPVCILPADLEGEDLTEALKHTVPDLDCFVSTSSDSELLVGPDPGGGMHSLAIFVDGDGVVTDIRGFEEVMLRALNGEEVM